MLDADARYRVLDEEGLPVRGLRVRQVHEARVLEESRTDSNGGFLRREAAEVELHDRLGLRPVRVLAEAGRTLTVGRADAEGWLATGAPLVSGNRVELLVDAAQFHAVEAAVASARRSLRMSQLLFQEGFTAHPNAAGGGPPLLTRLRQAAERGVEIRVLVNENAVIPDSYDELAEALRGHPRVRVGRLPMSPNVAHAKILVVDGVEALLVGPPFEQRYWDVASHVPHDPRRPRAMPFHDYGLRLRGPIVHHLDALFADLWNARPGADDVLLPAPPQPPTGGQTLQLATTLPRQIPHGPSRTILEAYLRALARASRFVYVETQYFTSRSMAEAVARALEATPDLEVVLVLNTRMDIPTYDTWQARRLKEVGYPNHPRLGVFTLRTTRRGKGGKDERIYTHSKLSVVDDVWATLGSANLDSASLEEVDEFGVSFDPNIEANVLLLDGVADAPRTGLVARIRRRAWAEHLGDRGVWQAALPAEGVLALWRRAAEANLRALHEDATFPCGHVLPFPVEGVLPDLRAQEARRA